MTTTEKALELIEKFNLPTGLMTSERKECALICVREILHEIRVMKQNPLLTQYSLGEMYWMEVEHEIKKDL